MKRVGSQHRPPFAAGLVSAWPARQVLLLLLLALPVSRPGLAAEEAPVAGWESAETAPELSAAPPTAAGLLARFERRLDTAPGAADIAALMNEGERLQAAALPRLRFNEMSSWNFGELVELGFGASLAWSLSDPQNEAQRELVAQRLKLASHDARSQRASQLEEFRRTLRLLAHLEQVEALLVRHRDQLLALRPGWRELEHYLLDATAPGTGSAAGAREPFLIGDSRTGQVGFLEVVQALERTRRERSLLLIAVAQRAGVEVRKLEGIVLGTPPLPDPATVTKACLASGGVENDDTIRAALLLEESRLAAEVDAARALPQVSFDLSGNARYSNSSLSRHPWTAHLRLALRVVMPAGAGGGGEISAAVTPSGLSQELSVGWPPAADPIGPGRAAARRVYRRTLSEARFGTLSDLKALKDALDNLRLRRVELTSARRSAISQGADLDLINAAAQAELALLNAELEVDLASMEAAAECQ